VKLRTLLAAIFAAMIIASPAAATAHGLNFNDDRAPNPEIQEDELVIAEHDVGEMSSPLDYYDDDGEVTSLPATYNKSQNTTVGVDFSNVDASAYYQFPRVDGESENEYNWTSPSDWATTSGASSSVTVSDADNGEVEKVEVAGTVASTETASASFSNNVSITSDVSKRTLMFVGSISNFQSGATVQIRAVDSDGDYRYAEVNASRMGNESDVIATGNATGVVFQEKLNDLQLAGSGDGTMQEIVSVDVVVLDNDATVTVAGLDLDRKTEVDIGEVMRDTDDDGDKEATTATDIWTDGKTRLTSIDTLGSTFDSASIKDLSVYDVSYRFEDVASDEHMVEFSNADAYSYPKKVELYGDLEVPSAIDLTHGTLELTFSQELPGERYVTAEIAEDSDSSEGFGNLSDSAYTSVVSSINADGEEHTLDASVSADQNYRIHMVVLLQNEEVDDLQMSGMAGPTGGSGGFFSTLFGQISAGIALVVGGLGLSRYFGGGA
jgi:hypothetical protein